MVSATACPGHSHLLNVPAAVPAPSVEGWRIKEKTGGWGWHHCDYLHDPDNHDGMITDLEPDILECEVKWALEIITVNMLTMYQAMSISCF